jgi:hypothetical protein
VHLPITVEARRAPQALAIWLALVMAAGVAWLGFTEARSTGEIVASVLGPLFLGGVGYYLSPAPIGMKRKPMRRRVPVGRPRHPGSDRWQD